MVAFAFFFVIVCTLKKPWCNLQGVLFARNFPEIIRSPRASARSFHTYDQTPGAKSQSRFCFSLAVFFPGKKILPWGHLFVVYTLPIGSSWYHAKCTIVFFFVFFFFFLVFFFPRFHVNQMAERSHTGLSIYAFSVLHKVSTISASVLLAQPNLFILILRND